MTTSEENQKNIIKAKCSGNLNLGGISIPCAVLENGTRVMSGSGIYRCFAEMGSSALRMQEKMQDEDCGNIPVFAAFRSLQPFINGRFDSVVETKYISVSGVESTGYPIESLVEICKVWIEARNSGSLKTGKLLEKADKAQMLINSFASVGITALVDEATGYQSSREADALQKMFRDTFLIEQATWQKTFPDSFFESLAKIYNLEIKAGHGPGFVGHIINSTIYKKLNPDMVAEIKSLRSEKGSKALLHQFLNSETKKALTLVLAKVESAAVLSGYDKEQFYKNVDILLPDIEGEIINK